MNAYLLLMMFLPGVLFYVVAGKRDKLDTASGWLVAGLIGLLMSAIAVSIAYISGNIQMLAGLLPLFVGGKIATPTEQAALLVFTFSVYLFAIVFALSWRLFRSRSRKLNSLLLRTESFFFDEGIMVSKNILENFLLAASAAEVVPDMLIRLQSGKVIRGRCINYQWIKPQRLTVAIADQEEKEKMVAFIDVDSIETIYILNCEAFRHFEIAKDPWYFLRLVDKRLPVHLGLEKKEHRDM